MNDSLEVRIKKIEERNKRVEKDKAWEVSTVRKVLILIMTYIVATCYLMVADTTNPFLGAVVPCGGFFLSVQSLNAIKKIWIKKVFEKKLTK